MGKRAKGIMVSKRLKGYKFFRLSKAAAMNEQEKHVHLCEHAVKDMTKNKMMEKELRATKEQLQSLVNHSADAIAIVDLHGQLLQMNSAFEKLHGWSLEEIQNQPLPMVPDEHIAEAKELHKKIISGEAISGFETIKQRKDGSRFEASVTISPIKDDEGKVIAFSSITRNISERIRMENSLRESEAKYRLIAEALIEAEAKYRSLVEEAIVGVYLYQDGRLAYVNPCLAEMVGYTQEEILALDNILLLVTPEDRAFLTENINNRLNGIKSAQYRIRALRKDHSIAEVELIGTRTSYNGKPALIGTILDVTERVRTEELLRKSEKLSVVGQLAAGVAHEIRNPLTALKGFTQLLKSRNFENKEYLDIMLTELERINYIVNEFMMISKPHPAHFQPRDVRVMLHNVISLLDTQAILNKVQLIPVFETNIPLIQCDENQIKQVFINILKNAIEAMPLGGEILISANSFNEREVIISFIDHGAGIPEDRIPKLGEPFYTTKEKGTGLGLMVSYKIIEVHQGSIHIKSEIDKGTAIEVVLPALPDKAGNENSESEETLG